MNWRTQLDEAGIQLHATRNLKEAELNEQARAAYRAEEAGLIEPRTLSCLDLFCSAGGASRGLQQAGFHVTGVDINPQPNYCGDVFVQADAMTFPLEGYDLIWASPPCQRYSEATPIHDRDAKPDHLPVMLHRLRTQPTPYICENVEGAAKHFDHPVVLCGSMFGLDIWRHRYFEIGNIDVFFLLPPCNHSFRPVVVSGRGMRMVNGRRWNGSKAEEKRDAMQIDWMTTDEIEQAIPPAYSRFLAEQFIQRIGESL